MIKKNKTHNYHINRNIRKIRIIGGKWRGRKIIVTPHSTLRPTTNQIRETLFNWLTPIIQGANCLDCFSGSGALGFEALSRYAHTVTFLEKNKKISNEINKTIQILNLQKKTQIITTNCITWLTSPTNRTTQYNIVFIDPPFSKFFYIKKIINLLNNFKYLSHNSWIYIENKNNNNNLNSIIPNTWELYRKKTTKVICYQIYITH